MEHCGFSSSSPPVYGLYSRSCNNTLSHLITTLSLTIAPLSNPTTAPLSNPTLIVYPATHPTYQSNMGDVRPQVLMGWSLTMHWPTTGTLTVQRVSAGPIVDFDISCIIYWCPTPTCHITYWCGICAVWCMWYVVCPAVSLSTGDNLSNTIMPSFSPSHVLCLVQWSHTFLHTSQSIVFSLYQYTIHTMGYNISRMDIELILYLILIVKGNKTIKVINDSP